MLALLPWQPASRLTPEVLTGIAVGDSLMTAAAFEPVSAGRESADTCLEGGEGVTALTGALDHREDNTRGERGAGLVPFGLERSEERLALFLVFCLTGVI